MFSVKELTEMREQLRREIQEMDNQIYELEMFYIEDTKEAVHLYPLRATFSRGSITISLPKHPKCRQDRKNKKFKM